MKAHLLYESDDFDFQGELPSSNSDLIQDLELSTLFAAMAQGSETLYEVSKRVVLTSLRDPEAIIYRQQILADCIANPEMIREMYTIAVASQEERRGIFWGRSSQFPSSILSGSLSELELYVRLLKRLRKVADDYVSTVSSKGLATLFRDLQNDLDDDYLSEVNRHLKELRFRNGVLMSAELARDNSGINYVLLSPTDSKVGWKERIGIGPRSSYSFTIPPRDEAGAQSLSDLESRGINLVANAVAQSADHIQSYFAMLRVETGFYVSCLNLRDQLVARGEATAFPTPEEWGLHEQSFSELRDVALVLRASYPVVGNDIATKDVPLVIITGANSGGKSTFLRSIGQAQLMMQCGLFVAAEAYRASVADGLFTHFIREEDSTMRSGRLVEELVRMSAIAEVATPRCVILFNESFAATNEREGSEIARQVVRALLERDIKVFFVTHQYDFASSFYNTGQSPSALFLRAERDNNEQRRFKLVEGEPLSTSFGGDLYEKVFLANEERQSDSHVSTGAIAASNG